MQRNLESIKNTSPITVEIKVNNNLKRNAYRFTIQILDENGNKICEINLDDEDLCKIMQYMSKGTMVEFPDSEFNLLSIRRIMLVIKTIFYALRPDLSKKQIILVIQFLE